MLSYEFSIKGMKCSSCSNKIEDILKKTAGVKSSNINLITEMGRVVVDNEEVLIDIKNSIIKMGFKLSSFKKIEKTNSNINRFFTIKSEQINIVHELLKEKIGIVNIHPLYQDSKIKLEYDPNLIKGWELNEYLLDKKINFSYENDLINNINEINNFSTSISTNKFIICIVLTAILISNTMILPKFSIGKILMTTFIFEDILSVFLSITLIISLIIIFMFGLDIYKRSATGFYYFKILNMETLISLGSIASLALTLLNMSRLLTIYYGNDRSNMEKIEMFVAHSIEAAATVISISIIGKYIEESAKLNIRKHTSLMFSKEKLAFGVNCDLVKPGNKKLTSFIWEKKIDVGLLEKDDFVRINSGEFLLYDSIIMSGEIYINESMTYGFEKIEKKVVGERIKSGCEIEKGTCVVSVTDVLEESVLYKVTKEMNESLNQKLKFQIFIDRIVKYFVPTIVLISIITFIIWGLIYLFNSKDKEYLTLIFVFERAISVMVVSCPCAFGLAIPTVTTISLNKALEYGILIKNLALLPEIKNAKNVVFDKTGTLTEIKKEVKIEYENPKISTIPLYSMLAICEKDQKHPLAAPLYSFALKMENLEENNRVSLFSELEKKSNGISAVFAMNSNNNTTYNFKLGNQQYIEEELKIKLKDTNYNELSIKNSSLVYICVERELMLTVSIDTSTEIRKEAYQIIKLLNTMNKEIFILSGDNKESVKMVGAKLGIREENIYGDVDNKRKKDFFLNLKNSNQKSIMIGDGINDILSLSEADFGISFNAASQLNMVAADIIFIKEDLGLIIILMKLSRLTFIFIWLNVFWAFFYNICLLPISAGVFISFWDLEMSPTLSSFSMLCSSLFIILSSNTLRLFDLRIIPEQKKVVDLNYKSLKKCENTIHSISDIEDQKSKDKSKDERYYEFVSL